jgi:hypothetical protein
MIDRSSSNCGILEELGSCGIRAGYRGEDSSLARCAAGLYSVRTVGSAARLVERAMPASWKPRLFSKMDSARRAAVPVTPPAPTRPIISQVPYTLR